MQAERIPRRLHHLRDKEPRENKELGHFTRSEDRENYPRVWTYKICEN